MRKSKKISATSELVDQAFDVLDKALRATGRLLADNEEDIRNSNPEIDLDSIDLPRDLYNPKATLERGRYVLDHGFSTLSDKPSSTDKTRRDMAQAARNGKCISEDLRQRMHRDRANSIKNMNKS